MWLSLFPQIVGAVLLLMAPGLLVATALRYKGFDVLALAPALSVGIIIIAATGSPFLGIRFTVFPVAVVTVILSTAAWFGSRARRGKPSIPSPGRWWIRAAPFAALILAAGIIGMRVTQIVGSPENFSQTYDAVFHLNSIKFAMDTGLASSLTIGEMTGGGLYPAGWQAVTALVGITFSLDVPVAVNITNVVISSVFWPLGCLLLTRWSVGRSASSALTAGIASASLGAFPFLMMDFGVLYPNLLSISVLPAAVALALAATGAARDQGRDVATVLSLLLCLVGLIIAHPTTFMAWLTWTIPMVLFWAWRRLSPRRGMDFRAGPGRTKPLIGLGAYGTLLVVLWFTLRPPEEASFWHPYHTVPQALGEALFIAPMDLPPAWLVAPLVLLGLWVCFKKQRFLWLAGVFLIFSGLFVVVSGFPVSAIRNLLTGVWYNDSYRVAALLPLVAVPLAALGADRVEHVLVQRMERGKLRNRRNSPPVLLGRFQAEGGSAALRLAQGMGVLALVAAAVFLGQKGGMETAVSQALAKYRVTDQSPLVSTDELAVLKRLPETTPPDAVLIGNPYTGAALSYALGDRRSAQLHILSYISPALAEIYDNLGSVASDPAVCQAVRAEKSFYVLDFGSEEVHEGHHTPSGLSHLERNPGVKLIDSQGEAKVYEITACGAQAG